MNTLSVFSSSAKTIRVESAKSIGKSEYFSNSVRHRFSDASLEGTNTTPPRKTKSMHATLPPRTPESKWMDSVRTASVVTDVRFQVV